MKSLTSLVLLLGLSMSSQLFADGTHCSMTISCKNGTATCLVESKDITEQAACGSYRTWSFCGKRPAASFSAEDVRWDDAQIICCDKDDNAVSGRIGSFAAASGCASPGSRSR